MAASAISISTQQATLSDRATENIKKKLEALSKLNPMAKAVMD